jgi:hypothetical protein
MFGLDMLYQERLSVVLMDHYRDLSVDLDWASVAWNLNGLGRDAAHCGNDPVHGTDGELKIRGTAQDLVVNSLV